MRMVDCQLTIESLSHSIGKNKILDDINLNINTNQVVTLLGPNGAGKSTLLKSMAGTFYPQYGNIKINSFDPLANRSDYLNCVGYMPETPVIMPELTVEEQLKFMAHMKAIKNNKQNIKHVLKLCHLQDVKNKRTAKLSLGYKQRLNLAQALLNDPPLILMDEPLNGLDPYLMVELRNLIQDLKKSRLIIISTHYLAEAQLISDRVLVMKNGILLKNINLNDSKNMDLEEIYLRLTQSLEQIS